jgi:hypothetical protein
LLAINGCIVTIDAMGRQTAIAGQIREQGGDYLLALKGDHKKAYAAVKPHFYQHILLVPRVAVCSGVTVMSTRGSVFQRAIESSTSSGFLERSMMRQASSQISWSLQVAVPAMTHVQLLAGYHR